MSDDKLKETQPIEPPTAADVLEVFGHFQEGLLRRIDERDANVLKLIQNTVNELLAENRRLAKLGDDHEKRISGNTRDIDDLRSKYNTLASEVQALKFKDRR